MDMRFSLTLFLSLHSESCPDGTLPLVTVAAAPWGLSLTTGAKSEAFFWKAVTGMVGCSSVLSLHGKALVSRVLQGWPP